MCCDSFVLFIWTRVGRPTLNAIIIRNIDGLREDAHPDMEAIHGFIDAGGFTHGSELREEFDIFKNSQVENIEGLFNVMNMMIAGNSE